MMKPTLTLLFCLIAFAGWGQTNDSLKPDKIDAKKILGGYICTDSLDKTLIFSLKKKGKCIMSYKTVYQEPAVIELNWHISNDTLILSTIPTKEEKERKTKIVYDRFILSDGFLYKIKYDDVAKKTYYVRFEKKKKI